MAGSNESVLSTADSDEISHKNSESGYFDSKSKNEQIQRFFHDENQIKRIIKFTIQDWRKMLSNVTGKRLSFKSSFSDNLSLLLQETGNAKII